MDKIDSQTIDALMQGCQFLLERVKECEAQGASHSFRIEQLETLAAKTQVKFTRLEGKPHLSRVGVAG